MQTENVTALGFHNIIASNLLEKTANNSVTTGVFSHPPGCSCSLCTRGAMRRSTNLQENPVQIDLKHAFDFKSRSNSDRKLETTLETIEKLTIDFSSIGKASHPPSCSCNQCISASNRGPSNEFTGKIIPRQSEDYYDHYNGISREKKIKAADVKFSHLGLSCGQCLESISQKVNESKNRSTVETLTCSPNYGSNQKRSFENPGNRNFTGAHKCSIKTIPCPPECASDRESVENLDSSAQYFL